MIKTRLGALGVGGLLALAAPAQADAPLRVSVDGRALIVTGPSGYCVDREAARTALDGAVIVLGSCAALGGGRAVPVGKSAILTASVAFGDRGAAAGPLIDRLATFFDSEVGHGALSRSGDAAQMKVLSSTREADVLLLEIEDQGPGGMAGAGARYWRAILVLRGRLVTLTALSPESDPVGSDALRAVLRIFVQRMEYVNRREGG